jgi:3-oxoacyl-[acyl-carrier-protein] synthase II
LRRVVITGLGVVSPIGIGKNEYWQALRSGKNGVARITHFDADIYPVKIAAEVKNFKADDWMDHKEARRTDRVIHFTMAAGELAVKDSALDVSKLDKERFGVFLGSAEGGIFTSYENIRTLIEKGPNRVSPFFIPMMISNMPAAYLAIRYGAKGPNICVVTACATATHTMIEAFNTIKRDEADLILAGGAESAISPLGVAGFAAIKALSTRNDEPGKASRPFDIDRDGFILGEGAGVLVLEELEHARARNARIYAEITGYGSTCDAYHITAPDPEGSGAARAMRQAVDRSGWQIEEVDLINAHGTSTPLNDKMEAKAIRSLFGAATDKVLVNSTKSMIGHGLGAAGALETIAAIQSLIEGFVHPTLNLDNQDPDCEIHVVGKEGLEHEVHRVLISNFGFGGHNAVLAIKSFSE